MRKLLFLLSLLLPAVVLGQIPSEYTTTEINALTERVNALRDTYDYVIPIIERLPIRPTSYSIQASGNWGSEWTGANKYDSQIFDRAKRPVVVFVFDTSPFWEHEALKDFAWNEEGRSWTGEPELKDGHGHGTHVAGIVGAQSDTYQLGIARALVRKGLLRGIPYEVLSDGGGGYFSWTAAATRAAIDRAKDLQAQGHFVVFNYSLGGPYHAQTDQVLKEARAAGIFICAASGNTSNEGIQFPGSSEGSAAIGAINNQGRRASFSTWGEGLYMGAPGQNILSTWKGGRLVELSGTSMATPTQAGLVAIAASVYPDLDAEQIRKLLIDVATDIDPAGYDPETGHGYDYIGKILDYEPPQDDPDDPDDPEEPETPTKKTRVVEITLTGTYSSMYQRRGGSFYPFQVKNLRLKFRTDLYAEDAAEQLTKYVDQYFHRRAFILDEQADFLDAGYWAGRFLEMIGKSDDLKIWVDDMTVISEKGYQGKPAKPFLPVFAPKASYIEY